MKIQKHGVDHKHNDLDVGRCGTCVDHVVDSDLMEDARGDTKERRHG